MRRARRGLELVLGATLMLAAAAHGLEPMGLQDPGATPPAGGEKKPQGEPPPVPSTAPPTEKLPPPQEPPKKEEKAAAPTAPVLDYTARFDLASYEAALGRIAEAYPDLLRVRSLGKSRGGREVWLAVAADTSAGDPGRMPAAAVLTDLAPLVARVEAGARESAQAASRSSPSVAGPEAALFALASLLERARADTKVRGELARCALYFVPAPDPDGTFPAGEADAVPAPRRCRLDRNFPASWEPFDAEPSAAGPYPLCEPESRMLARFLLDRANLSMVVALTKSSAPERKDAPGGSPSSTPGGTDVSSGADSSGSASGGSCERSSVPGSLETFCREILDASVLCPEPWKGAPRTTAVGSAPEGFSAVAAQVEGLLGQLPRLECGATKTERLRTDLWLVDLTISNAGLLSTFGETGRDPDVASVRMKVSGARVVACAQAGGAAGSFEASRGGPEIWALGHLGGGERVGVRLVVQADEGAGLQISCDSLRGGTARASASLR